MVYTLLDNAEYEAQQHNVNEELSIILMFMV